MKEPRHPEVRFGTTKGQWAGSWETNPNNSAAVPPSSATRDPPSAQYLTQGKCSFLTPMQEQLFNTNIHCTHILLSETVTRGSNGIQSMAVCARLWFFFLLQQGRRNTCFLLSSFGSWAANFWLSSMKTSVHQPGRPPPWSDYLSLNEFHPQISKLRYMWMISKLRTRSKTSAAQLYSLPCSFHGYILRLHCSRMAEVAPVLVYAVYLVLHCQGYVVKHVQFQTLVGESDPCCISKLCFPTTVSIIKLVVWSSVSSWF